jgi:ribosome biogenesis GTPase
MFSDIVHTASNCRYKDCTHGDEPGLRCHPGSKRRAYFGRAASQLLQVNRRSHISIKKSEIGLKELKKEKYKKIAVDAKKYRKFMGNP